MSAKMLDLDELNDLDMGTIDGKVNRTLVAGKYLFVHSDAKLAQGEDKKTGEPRLELTLRSTVRKVIKLDDKDLDPKDFVGQSIFERFYSPTTENIGYVRTYFDNVLGAEAKDKFGEIIKALGSGDVQFIGRVNARVWQGKPQADLSREPKDFIGFEKLSDEQLA